MASSNEPEHIRDLCGADEHEATYAKVAMRCQRFADPHEFVKQCHRDGARSFITRKRVSEDGDRRIEGFAADIVVRTDIV